ncbi:MAG TPA: sugar phosphate nucleotidyltransferase, partial [Candidatus Saccharimonadales bacterium]|nr:sugar phosphate nucleotidyltransferase [Candidatus Saccharimonadales bacterium]
ATLAVATQDTEALIAVLPSDHFIGKPAEFAAVVDETFNFLGKEKDYVATIGIKPTEPNTGLGYIKLGEQLVKSENHPIFLVEKFVEKPDQATANRFFKSWEYLWNGGYYLFCGQTLLDYYQKFIPESLKKLQQYRTTSDPKDYEAIDAEPIDKAISEKLNKLAVMPADLDWSDLGNWITLHAILEKAGKLKAGENHLGVDTENSLVISSGKLIATVGIKDMIIVDTHDAILVCNQKSVHKVKDLVEKLKEQNKHNYI